MNYNLKHFRIYTDLVDYYQQDIDACVKYFETLDMFKFVKKLDKSGFLKEIVGLRNYVEYPTTLNYISEAEKEFLEIELISYNGGISEANIYRISDACFRYYRDARGDHEAQGWIYFELMDHIERCQNAAQTYISFLKKKINKIIVRFQIIIII